MIRTPRTRATRPRSGRGHQAEELQPAQLAVGRRLDAKALGGHLRSPARRSASASEASAIRRSCIRSCGRAAATRAGSGPGGLGVVALGGAGAEDRLGRGLVAGLGLELLVGAALQRLHRRQLALLLDPNRALLLGHGYKSSGSRWKTARGLKVRGGTGVGGIRRGRAVHVDVAPADRAAGVLGDEPAAVAVVAVGADVDPAAEWNHPRIDRDRLEVVQRQRGPGRERHVAQRHVLGAAPVGPAAGAEREGDRALLVAPVAARPPVGRAGRPAAGRRGRRARRGHPAAVTERIDVVGLTVEADARALHRQAGGRVEPVDPMQPGEARRLDHLADEPRLRRGPVLGDRRRRFSHLPLARLLGGAGMWVGVDATGASPPPASPAPPDPKVGGGEEPTALPPPPAPWAGRAA